MIEKEHFELPFESLKVEDGFLLRQLRTDEAEQLFNLVDQNREHLGKWLPWVDSTHSLDDSKEFILGTINQRQVGSQYGYGMILDGEIVGHISLMHLSDDKEPEIGYWIGSKVSGRGHTTKAVDSLTNFGLETLGLEKIIIRAHIGNEASNQVALKAGYSLQDSVDDIENGPINVWAMYGAEK